MVALLRHADVMVNFATTVTLESAIVDTPTLLVAFSPIDPGRDAALRRRPALPACTTRRWSSATWCPWPGTARSWSSWVNRYLDDPSLYRAQRATIVREWVQFTDGASGRRLGDAILRHAGLEPPAAARR